MAGPTVLLVDHSQTGPGVALDVLGRTLQRFVDEHFVPVWETPCALEVATELRPGCWALVLMETADQSQALGYHDLTPDGLPLSKVFVKTTLADGQRVSATACHELAEMLVDPALNLTVQAPDGTVYAYEVCDPVEGAEFELDGLSMHDFVYPSWFQGFWPEGSVRFDHLGRLTKPFALLEHGYMPVFRDGAWTKVFGSLPMGDVHGRRDPRGHRRERRGRPQVRSGRP
jgi:hypothetical protein